MSFNILCLVASLAVAHVEGQCQEPGNAKCYSVSNPVGPVGSGCCSDAQCQPWLAEGETFTVPVDWYCLYTAPIALNGACDNKVGKCTTGLSCIAGVCTDPTATSPAITTPAVTTPAQCQQPGNAKCYSISDPVGLVGGDCCSGAQCQPWLEEGETFTVPVDWYCQSTTPIAVNEACDNKVGKCATGLSCIAGVCTDPTATTPAITTPAVTTPAITTPAQCQQPGDAKCYSISDPVGLVGGDCCSGAQCQPWLAEGETFTVPVDWYCQSTTPIAVNEACDNKVGKCATGLSCIDGVCTDPTATTPAVTTPAVTTPAITTPAVTTPAVTTPAQCQQPGNAKCYSISAPVGPVGLTCCSGAQCQPWLEEGETFTVPVDWYCLSTTPIAQNEACDNKEGHCDTGLSCIAGVCSDKAVTTTTTTTSTTTTTTTSTTTSTTTTSTSTTTTSSSTTTTSTSTTTTSTSTTTSTTTTTTTTSTSTTTSTTTTTTTTTTTSTTTTTTTTSTTTTSTTTTSTTTTSTTTSSTTTTTTSTTTSTTTTSTSTTTTSTSTTTSTTTAACIAPTEVCLNFGDANAGGTCCEGAGDCSVMDPTLPGYKCKSPTTTTTTTTTTTSTTSTTTSSTTSTSTTTLTTTTSTSTTTTTTVACIASTEVCLNFGDANAGGTCCSGVGDCTVMDPTLPGYKCV